MQPCVCRESAHSGQVDSDDIDDIVGEDEEQATTEGTLRADAFLDGLVECLGIGNLHLPSELGERKTE